MPQIEVAFDIDANGILSVSAKDNATGKEQSVRIEGSGGLDKSEIDRMVSDAEAHASEDHARRERIEKHNHLDSMIYQAEKTLSENEEKIEEADKEAVRSAIESARADLESDDVAQIDAAQQRLEQALHKVAEVLYQAQAAAQGADAGGDPSQGAAPGAEAAGEDVVDAEYTEEKDNQGNG
jgi:molecular chaperone DnaK